jgi:alpha-glucoside transport system substrate-binding protein
MSKKPFIVLLLVSALLMAACQPAAPATEAPMEQPTEAPMEQPTEAPMEEPTEAPMEEPTEAPTEEPMGGEIDCMGVEPGAELTMFYQWSGVEEENILSILQPLVDACGIKLAPTATRDQAYLDTQVQAGTPPDVAFFNVTQLEQYQDQLVPMDELGANADNYPAFWKDIGTVNGVWLGVPVKADPKTIVWYSPLNFDAFGYAVPATWDDFTALADTIAADDASPVPFALGFESGDATGWTGTDFIQDIMLVQQGPDYVNGIISGDIPYNDDGVRQAWETYGAWATDPAYTVGGADGTVTTNFLNAIYEVFSDPPEAMMVKQSGFAGGEIVNQYPDLVYGEDYDFFGVPGAQGLQGGSDWLMAFSDAPEVHALIAYLTSDVGAQKWAEVGFGVSPNSAATDYTDATLQKFADLLASAKGFTPDIGDSIPGGFGSAEFTGVTDYVSGGDLTSILDNLAAVQAEALGK